MRKLETEWKKSNAEASGAEKSGIQPGKVDPNALQDQTTVPPVAGECGVDTGKEVVACGMPKIPSPSQVLENFPEPTSPAAPAEITSVGTKREVPSPAESLAEKKAKTDRSPSRSKRPAASMEPPAIFTPKRVKNESHWTGKVDYISVVIFCVSMFLGLLIW